jgi:cytochrome P450
MRSIDELVLPEMPIESAEMAADPMPHILAARREHPWLAKCSFGYVVHEYQAIKDILYMDDKVVNSTDDVVEIMGAKGTRWGRFMQDLMIGQSGATHARLRGSVAAVFTPRNANLHRQRMREEVSRLLDEWAPKGAFDFAEFAAHFPVRVMFGLIGASPEHISAVRTSLEAQGMSYCLDPSMLPDMEAAYDQLYGFIDGLIAERRRIGELDQDHLLDVMIAAADRSEISELEMREMLIVFFAAGYDTSKNMLTLIAWRMLQHPQEWTRCADDRPYCSLVVEEVMRLHSPSNTYRTVTEAFDYRGVHIPKDTLLFFTLSHAGRDPEAFADADEFRPERQHRTRHMGFGRGAHICIGQYLARAQIEEGLHLTAQRITRPRLAGEVTWRTFLGSWGIVSLPVSFQAGARREAAHDVATV